MLFTSADRIAPRAHFDAKVSNLAHVGAPCRHCNAQRATYVCVTCIFTPNYWSVHSGCEGLAVNRVQPGVNMVNAARFAASFRLIHVAYDPVCTKNAAQRPFY